MSNVSIDYQFKKILIIRRANLKIMYLPGIKKNKK